MKKKLLIGLAGIFFLCIIVSLIGSLAGGNKADTKVEPTTVAKAEVKPIAEAKATTAPKATEAPKPTATATAKPIGTSRDNPVPVGTAFTAPNKIEVTVLGFERNAAKKIKGYNQFNSDPQEGNEQVLVSVKVRNVKSSSEVVRVAPSSFGLVGSSGKIINPASLVVKNALRGELFEGGTVEGEIPFEILATEKDIVLIYDAGALGGQRYFLALTQ